MRLSFDQVLPALLRTCEGWEHADKLKRVAVVRDLRGLIRLAVDFREGADAHLEHLRDHVSAALGPWFTGEILIEQSKSPQLAGVARRVLKMATPWDDARYPDELGGERTVTPKRWSMLERRLGKETWLEGAEDAPWPLSEDAPKVVTFYSFKGGVGRTTALCACALLAARAGERVVLIDLDLESPGLATAFDVTTTRGVLDVLVDHLATAQLSLEDATSSPRDLREVSTEHITVIPAGTLGGSYLEKLARLDFHISTVGAKTSSPVQEALLALLNSVRTQLAPSWILLDARAGLHDLSGLSLHGLSHLDVVFSRANPQGEAGLGLVIPALATRLKDAGGKVLLVHAMAPANKTEARTERAAHAQTTHALFCEFVYGESPPAEDAEDADHQPLSLRREERIERNPRVRDAVGELTSEDFQLLLEAVRARLSVGAT